MIKRCSCEHKAQDKLHGEGRRVFNETMKVVMPHSCTVCGSSSKTAKPPSGVK